jgi:hypothetical protein
VSGDCAVQLVDASTGVRGATWSVPLLPAGVVPLSPTTLMFLGHGGAMFTTGVDGAGGSSSLGTIASGRALTFTRGGSHALACGNGADAWLVPVGGGTILQLDTADRRVSAMALSDDGALAAAGCGSTALEEGLRDYTLLVWEVPGGRRRARLDVLSFPSALTFLADGSLVVATSVGQMYQFMPDGDGFAITGTFVRPGGTGPTEQAHAYGLTCVASGPAGRFVATAAGGTNALGNEVAVWDVATRTRRWQHDAYDRRPTAVDVAPDGSALLVVEPVAGRVELWSPLDALGRAP